MLFKQDALYYMKDFAPTPYGCDKIFSWKMCQKVSIKLESLLNLARCSGLNRFLFKKTSGD